MRDYIVQEVLHNWSPPASVLPPQRLLIDAEALLMIFLLHLNDFMVQLCSLKLRKKNVLFDCLSPITGSGKVLKSKTKPIDIGSWSLSNINIQ